MFEELTFFQQEVRAVSQVGVLAWNFPRHAQNYDPAAPERYLASWREKMARLAQFERELSQQEDGDARLSKQEVLQMAGITFGAGNLSYVQIERFGRNNSGAFHPGSTFFDILFIKECINRAHDGFQEADVLDALKFYQRLLDLPEHAPLKAGVHEALRTTNISEFALADKVEAKRQIASTALTVELMSKRSDCLFSALPAEIRRKVVSDAKSSVLSNEEATQAIVEHLSPRQ